jgi:hypothetical protein
MTTKHELRHTDWIVTENTYRLQFYSKLLSGEYDLFMPVYLQTV